MPAARAMEHTMETEPTEPRKDDAAAADNADDNADDDTVKNVLSAFNADQILTDPDALDPDDQHDEGLAATPDSPNPI